MSEEPYRWYYGYGKNPDQFHGDFATRELAVEEGLDMAACSYEEITIIEARHDILRTDIFDGRDILEKLSEENEEYANEDGDIGIDDATDEQMRSLETRLNAVVAEWLAEFKLGQAWSFAHIRMSEIVVVPPLVPSGAPTREDEG